MCFLNSNINLISLPGASGNADATRSSSNILKNNLNKLLIPVLTVKFSPDNFSANDITNNFQLDHENVSDNNLFLKQDTVNLKQHNFYNDSKTFQNNKVNCIFNHHNSKDNLLKSKGNSLECNNNLLKSNVNSMKSNSYPLKSKDNSQKCNDDLQKSSATGKTIKKSSQKCFLSVKNYSENAGLINIFMYLMYANEIMLFMDDDKPVTYREYINFSSLMLLLHFLALNLKTNYKYFNPYHFNINVKSFDGVIERYCGVPP